MPRKPRIQVAGGVFHVTTRGNRSQPIIAGDETVTYFMLELLDIAEIHGWLFHAYCVMTTHYHLLVATPKADLSAGMHRLNTRYAKWFNRRLGVEGHVFERRFRSVLIEDTPQLLQTLRYIELNPVRAGACARPADWTWSSYCGTAGLAARTSFLTVDRVLGLFGEDEARARMRYARFIRDGIAASR